MMTAIVTMIKKRHEYKYKLASLEALMLKKRLDPLLEYDKHSRNGYYEVRSLYFDDLYDHALLARAHGLNKRAKYRIRYYDHDLSYINLEKKAKERGLGTKTKLHLSLSEVIAILNNEIDFLLNKGALGVEFYTKLKAEIFRPKAIIIYRRLAYYYPLGNVRITIDDMIQSSLDVKTFLSEKIITQPIETNEAILEIKYDAYLPAFIQKALNNIKHSTTAYSKYASGRHFTMGDRL